MVDVWQAGGAQGADEESTVRVRLATRAELLVATLHTAQAAAAEVLGTSDVSSETVLDVRLFQPEVTRH